MKQTEKNLHNSTGIPQINSQKGRKPRRESRLRSSGNLSPFPIGESFCIQYILINLSACTFRWTIREVRVCLLICQRRPQTTTNKQTESAWNAVKFSLFPFHSQDPGKQANLPQENWANKRSNSRDPRGTNKQTEEDRQKQKVDRIWFGFFGAKWHLGLC